MNLLQFSNTFSLPGNVDDTTILNHQYIYQNAPIFFFELLYKINNMLDINLKVRLSNKLKFLCNRRYYGCIVDLGILILKVSRLLKCLISIVKNYRKVFLLLQLCNKSK